MQGKVRISGNKNSILPCLAACLLTEEDVTLRNVPKISDVDVFSELLQELGAGVERGDDWIRVRCEKVQKTDLREELVGKLRASVLLAGPLLSRKGQVNFPPPGGDVIGRRSIDTHLEGFKELGFKFKSADRYYHGWGKICREDKEIFLSEASVTATENLLLASVLGSSTIALKNCAEEPHVVDLCRLLVSMGARIEGVGASTLKVTGVKKLSGTDFTIRSDHVEFGTFAVAAAITGGKIEIDTTYLTDLESVIFPLTKMGVCFEEGKNSLIVSAGKLVSIPKLRVDTWPGFPTDMMSVAIVLATQARGVSLMHDWMYESRMFFVDKLISMGANITIADPHRVLVYGSTKLSGRSLETPDIRAGMALLLAALIAKGTSEINRAELIERGYENVVEKLASLGANIQRID